MNIPAYSGLERYISIQTESFHPERLEAVSHYLSAQWPAVTGNLLGSLATIMCDALDSSLTTRRLLWDRFSDIVSEPRLLPSPQSGGTMALFTDAETILSEAAMLLLGAPIESPIRPDVWARDVYEHIPPTFTPVEKPLTEEEFFERALKEPLRLAPKNLPTDWQSLANTIRIPDTEESLWDFLCHHIQAISFVKNDKKASFGNARAHPFFKSITIKSPTHHRAGSLNNKRRILSLLGHETFHHDFFWRHIAEHPAYAVSPDAQEKRAYEIENSLSEQMKKAC